MGKSARRENRGRFLRGAHYGHAVDKCNANQELIPEQSGARPAPERLDEKDCCAYLFAVNLARLCSK
jgi:hypothetical protein